MKNVRWIDEDHTLAAWENDDGTEGSGLAEYLPLTEHVKDKGDVAPFDPKALRLTLPRAQR